MCLAKLLEKLNGQDSHQNREMPSMVDLAEKLRREGQRDGFAHKKQKFI